MMNLIQKFLSKDRKNKNPVRENFKQFFFSLPEHDWLLNAETKAHFEKLFRHLPAGVLEKFLMDAPIVFIKSENLSELKTDHVLHNTVVVFPEFQKLLSTNKKSAVAYLAHEVALLLCELERVSADPMMNEIEADKFVCDLGLENELEEFLLMLDETIEKRIRLTYLTVNHFSKDQN